MRRCAARTAPRTNGRSSDPRNSRMSGAFWPKRAPLAAESAIATFHRTFSSGSCIHLRRRARVADGPVVVAREAVAHTRELAEVCGRERPRDERGELLVDPSRMGHQAFGPV